MADPDSKEQHTHFEDEDSADSTHIVRHESDRVMSKKEQGGGVDKASKSTSHLPMDGEKKHTRHSSYDPQAGIPRTSTQLSGRARVGKSSEYDRRYDGPYARPSVTMTRRASLVDELEAERIPSIPADYSGDAAATLQITPESVEFQPEPPPLNYDLWSRKWWILLFWSLVIFDSVICPIGLYYGLWYGLHVEHKMSANTVFSIVTAAVGGASILEYFLRLWKLVRKKSNCRVFEGAKWWHLDAFHWNFTFAWIIIMVELIIGTVQEHPPPRLITMVVPTMLYVFAVELLVMDALRYFERPLPVRISSIPRGAQVRPGIYSIIEDVIAVDGSGGTAYREALNRRYEASHLFRAMLRRLGLFWSLGSMFMAVFCTILIFTVDTDAAYTIGWSVPFIWAGIWTVATIWYVKRMLREEKIAWAEEIAEKAA